MNAEQLVGKDAWAMAGAVRGKSVSATALVQASLARIAATEPRINAFTDVLAERALRSEEHTSELQSQ